MKTELIYSAQKSGFLPGYRYANPRYFVGPRTEIESVVIVGSWPQIEEAYRFSNPKMRVATVPTPEALAEYLLKRDLKGDDAAPAGQASRRPAVPPAHEIPETAYLRTAEPRRDQASVEIPDGWRDLPWPVLRDLAASVSDTPIGNRPDAEAAVERELARRAGGAQAETRPETPAPPESTGETAAGDHGDCLAAVHRGAGRWYIMRGDETISGPYITDDGATGKEKAEKALEREQELAGER